MQEIIQLTQYESVILNVAHVGSMCEEFDPGPSDDDLFPEYYNCSVSAHHIDLRNNTIEDLNGNAMERYYKKVEGRKNRIAFFYVMKFLKTL